ncbi:hypothetical protein CHELA1G11_13642 [Hyphomicrobiales bacterium]|nr:hypothetical protein CHELA1G2_10672 [Hyphomicrobiales bacterium]CAH1673107.1 hypothetical protein CHELA1G11_13642 [Hyphomicrobiales bacterium]
MITHHANAGLVFSTTVAPGISQDASGLRRAIMPPLALKATSSREIDADAAIDCRGTMARHAEPLGSHGTKAKSFRADPEAPQVLS